MTPLKPHLVSAIYDWVLHNQMRPYILVDANYPATIVPPEFVEDGKLVLDIHPLATGASLMIGFDAITFNVRFAGKSVSVIVPMGAVLGDLRQGNRQGHGIRSRTDRTTRGQAEKRQAGTEGGEMSSRHCRCGFFVTTRSRGELRIEHLHGGRHAVYIGSEPTTIQSGIRPRSNQPSYAGMHKHYGRNK